MIRPTRMKLSPVITLLSPSPAASRRAQEILSDVFGLEKVVQGEREAKARVKEETEAKEADPLNRKFQTSFSSIRWDSALSKCPHSGTVLHWLSVDHNGTHDDDSSSSSITSAAPFSLLAITQEDTLEETRATLASQFPDSNVILHLKHILNRPMTVDTLLAKHQGLPILNLPPKDDNEAITTNSGDRQEQKQQSQPPNHKSGGGRLKEIAFTTYDDAVYDNGQTVLTRLSSSSLPRLVTGLYQWSNNTATSSNSNSKGGVHLRPLPAAQQDLKGNARSVVLTFDCDDVEEQLEQLIQTNENNNNNDNNSTFTQYRFGKIGFTGQGRGQVRVEAHSHDTKDNNENNKSQSQSINYLPGLDVRWCESTKPTSMFNEAHEAMLASSLAELQSTNVFGSKRDHNANANANDTDDERIGAADCWVEVRNMVKNPKGFLPRKGQRIATAPPSYPE